MGGPAYEERGLPTLPGNMLEDPGFKAWAAKQGQPITRATEARILAEMLAHYLYELRDAKRLHEERNRRVTPELEKKLAEQRYRGTEIGEYSRQRGTRKRTRRYAAGFRRVGTAVARR